jgi:hypothetical protein
MDNILRIIYLMGYKQYVRLQCVPDPTVCVNKEEIISTQNIFHLKRKRKWRGKFIIRKELSRC